MALDALVRETAAMFFTPEAMRFELLHALHAHARQASGAPFAEAALEERFGVSPVQFDLVVDWLVEAGYARVSAPAGHLAITEAGEAEMLAREAARDRETEAILAWLDAEKARIAEACRAEGLPVSEAYRRQKTAIEAVRARRQALEAAFRDLSAPIAAP
jgi:hypothetical protein